MACTLSLITPTVDREWLLPLTYEGLCHQTYDSWEWWVCDTSWRPSPFLSKLQDPRVHYVFQKTPLSIGNKRNILLDRCQGDIIVHIDDDDYYAPDYLERMIKALEGHDFCALGSWFAYDLKIQEGFYWKTQASASVHYVLAPIMGKTLQPYIFSDLDQVQHMAEEYGFTFCYTRAVAEKMRFPDLDFQEDRVFLSQLKEQGYALRMIHDEKGKVVKMVHDLNVSSIFPQYRIPEFMLYSYFPHLQRYLDAYRTLSS